MDFDWMPRRAGAAAEAEPAARKIAASIAGRAVGIVGHWQPLRVTLPWLSLARGELAGLPGRPTDQKRARAAPKAHRATPCRRGMER